MEVKLWWLDANSTISFAEAEVEAYNFAVDLVDHSAGYNDFSVFLDKQEDIDAILTRPLATKSATFNRSVAGGPEGWVQIVKGSNQGFGVGDFGYAGSAVYEILQIDLTDPSFDLFYLDVITRPEAVLQGQTMTDRGEIIGTECYMYDVTYTYPIRWLYIRNIKSVGAGYEIILSDVINKFDKAIPVNPGRSPLYNPANAYPLRNFARIVDQHKPKLIKVDWERYSTGVFARAYLFPSDAEWGDDLSINIKEILDILSKLYNRYLVFNPTRTPTTINTFMYYGYHEVKPLTVTTPVTTLALSDRILIEQGYLYEKVNVGYSIRLKYKYKIGATEYSGSVLRSGFGGNSGSIIDIDMSSYLINEGVGSYGDLLDAINEVLERYKAMYSRVSGLLTVDIPQEDTDLIVGGWYSITDIAEFNIILDTSYSVYLYLVKRDNDTCNFFILQTEKTTYAGLALPIKKVTGEDFKVEIPSLYVNRFNNNLQSPPLEDMEDEIWANRAIATDTPTDVNWTDTATWQIQLLEDMSVQFTDVAITAITIPAVNTDPLILTLDTDVSSMGEQFLLLKYQDNVNDYYITKDSGV